MRPALIAALLLGTVPADARPLVEDQLYRAPREPFGGEPQRRRDREVDVERVVVELEPDLEAQSLRGVVTHRFKVLAPELPVLQLDAKQLEVSKVSASDGAALDYELYEDKLRIRFSPPLKAGASESVRVEYSAAPREGGFFNGLSFYKKDERYPGQPDEMWSQGQPESNQRWIPLYDYPNERASSEMIAIVPEGFAALSNGVLASKGPGPRPGVVRWHWVQERPHVSYLIALYVGRFSEVKDRPAALPGSGKELPVSYWVPQGREGLAKRSFGKTPAMIEHFSALLGVDYPWVKYDQWLGYSQGVGGMENTSATRMAGPLLLDERAALDVDFDWLIAHELFHQWFGDLTTCKDWSHLWVNEAWARYGELLWAEKDRGADEAAWHFDGVARRYFSEYGRYARPIVSETYREPWDIFDMHTYNKGAWVIHMMRKELGEKRFWDSVKRFVREHQDTVVDTEDFRRAIEDQTGRTMSAFFAQWLYGAGHPHLKLKLSYDAGERKLNLSVTQKQVKKGLPVFRIKLPLALSDGRAVTAELEKEEQSFSWDAKSKPEWVAVDPGQTVLVQLERDWPMEMRVAELRSGPSVQGRRLAAEELAEKGGDKELGALKDCLLKDPFWGVAAACAEALGKLRGPRALEALAAGAKHAHPKVRRGAASALGQFTRKREAYDALKPLAESDPSVMVESAALSALGRLRLPEARALLESKLSVASYDENVRKGALSGLGWLGEDAPRALLKEWSGPGKPPAARGAAMLALARAGAGLDETREALEAVLELETDPSTLRDAAGALRLLGDRRAIPALERLAARGGDALRGPAESAAEALKERRGGLADELGALVEDLTKRIEKMEKKAGEAKGKKK